MGLLATIPSLGTFLVWAPGAIFLALSGHMVKASILAAFGAVVIGSVNNLLYPTLVSRKLEMHTVAAFLVCWVASPCSASAARYWDRWYWWLQRN